MNGRTITKTKALAMVIDAFEAGHHNDAQGYWNGAHEQSQDGYIARDIIEAEVPGLTMRHFNEEGGQ